MIELANQRRIADLEEMQAPRNERPLYEVCLHEIRRSYINSIINVMQDNRR
jgi:hypothetical protein